MLSSFLPWVPFCRCLRSLCLRPSRLTVLVPARCLPWVPSAPLPPVVVLSFGPLVVARPFLCGGGCLPALLLSSGPPLPGSCSSLVPSSVLALPWFCPWPRPVPCPCFPSVVPFLLVASRAPLAASRALRFCLRVGCFRVVVFPWGPWLLGGPVLLRWGVVLAALRYARPAAPQPKSRGNPTAAVRATLRAAWTGGNPFTPLFSPLVR